MNAFFTGFHDELMSFEKQALPALLRIGAALVGKGGKGAGKLLKKRGLGHLKPGSPEAIAKGNALIRKAHKGGGIKASPRGRQLGRKAHLGAGMEGVSTLVARPGQKVPIQVRKIIDPRGIAGPKMVRQREHLGKLMRKNPNMARFEGASTTKGGLRQQFFEHVPGKTMHRSGLTLAKGTPKSSPTTAVKSPKARAKGTPAKPSGPSAAKQVERAKRQAKRRGYNIGDLHEDNIIMAGGKPKIVDYMAVPRPKGGKFRSLAEKDKAVGVRKPALDKLLKGQEAAAAGKSTPFVDYIQSKKRPGNLAAQAYRGAPAMPIAKNPAEAARVEGVQRAAAAARGKGKRRSPADEIETRV
jgi:hypothetical protein